MAQAKSWRNNSKTPLEKSKCSTRKCSINGQRTAALWNRCKGQVANEATWNWIVLKRNMSTMRTGATPKLRCRNTPIRVLEIWRIEIYPRECWRESSNLQWINEIRWIPHTVEHRFGLLLLGSPNSWKPTTSLMISPQNQARHRRMLTKCSRIQK